MKSRKDKTKVPVVSENTGLSKAVTEAVLHFKEYHPASRFSRNLRTMLIEFLMFDGATEASYLGDLLYDLQGLFDLLEAIQSE